MEDFILHHYDNSPFAEKIRTLLGHKKATYRTVTIPVIMPKPDLVALTGGYRKTPVLQHKNHIYCDTRLMARVIDNQLEENSIFPGDQSLNANALAQWADQHLFSVAVALAFSPAGFAAFSRQVPQSFVDAFLNDRAKMSEGASGLSMEPNTALELIPIYLEQFENQLTESGPYVFGKRISIADFSIYHCLWFVANNAGVAPLLEGYPRLNQWLDTMRNIGHGAPTTIDAEKAIQISRNAEKQSFSQTDFLTVNDFNFGDQVVVTPTDYGLVPVTGELIVSKTDEIAVKRTDDRAGEVYVHFPRLGYKIAAA